MARYRTTIQSKKSAEEAFEYVADFANAREWDPGVVEGENLTGQPLGPDSRFRLVARFLGRRVPLEYRISAFEPPWPGWCSKPMRRQRCVRPDEDARVVPPFAARGRR